MSLRPQDPLRALPLPRLDTCSADEVLAYFVNGWELTEVLFESLTSEEAFYQAPYHNLRHPLIFYYVHPAVLYINKLQLAGLAAPLHPYFERLFETGVDEMSWDDMSKNEMLWPSLAACRDYRRRAFAVVREVILGHPGLRPGHPVITAASPLWALFLALEHERIHIETTSVLLRELALPLLRRPPRFPPPHPSHASADADLPANPWIAVAGGEVHIGKAQDVPTFGWDNEYGQRVVRVAPFRASQRLISNGELHAFVAAGGYQDARWWSDEGWRWRQFRDVQAPAFWVPAGPRGYALRLCFEQVAMPWTWPAVVNFHEAKAYAAWRGAKEGRPLRLLTEAEHHALRATLRDPSPAGMNRWLHGLRWGSEGPVHETLDPGGFADVFGNVWQWLEDVFQPLPGFTVHPYYADFSTPCFDGRHQMIMGGSFISCGDEATVHARFHFRPHFFQHAGLRLVDPA